MRLEGHEASALSRLFSASVFRDFGRQAQSPLFARLLKQTRIPTSVSRESTVGDSFDEAFSLLRRPNFRDDYVYRSAIAQKILLGRHSLNTATLLNEVRVGSRKADVVVLNGTSTAYEIKSERDSLVRLQSQVSAYSQVFAAVNVVASGSHLSDVLRYAPEDVGVMTLSERFRLRTEREALNLPDRTNPTMILEMLRMDEAMAVLARVGRETPDLPNTRLRTELRRIFSRLDAGAVHEAMVQVLRKTRSQSALSSFASTLPRSVRAVTLSIQPGPRSRDLIIEAVNTPLHEALAWK